MSEHPATSYFTGLAGLYAAHRPGYPDAAFAAMTDGLPAPITAADVGCGTGITTRGLAPHVARVIAIDPNADMLAEARRAGAPPGTTIECRAGTAEATGLADGAAGLVLCGQAFHWFDPDAALPELHRVLRRGGRLALLWNARDERDAFTAGYARVVADMQRGAEAAGRVVERNRSADPTTTEHFTSPRTLEWPNPQRLDLAGLLGRARSASYHPRSWSADPARAAATDDRLRALHAAHARDGVVILQHVTRLILAERAG